MSKKYPAAFKEQALIKVWSRDGRSIQSIADELNVKYPTLIYWMKNKAMTESGKLATKEKRPCDWSVEQQWEALHETHGLSGEALQAWCRERGLFAHHLASWKAAFCAQGTSSPSSARDLRTLKEENATLKRELVRKDKALAEAAALLVLQKKFRALWAEEEK
jgi:transposase-like protein